MANIKSAKKRILVAEANRQRNVAVNKAVSKGVLHKNTAARKKSRLVLAIKKLAK